MKRNIASIKGTQPSKWDKYYYDQTFAEPGDSECFEMDEITSATASQFARRMNEIEKIKGGTRKFHSGINRIENFIFVRWRPEGEIPNKDDKDDDDEQPELPPNFSGCVGDDQQAIYDFTKSQEEGEARSGPARQG